MEAFLPVPPTELAFIGSGPLPLTSLCMLDRYPNVSVHNIDRDVDALEASRKLCGILGYARMTFEHADITDATTTTKWQSYQVVFLAALVGMDTVCKRAILQSLAAKLKPGCLVVARSAHGLRTVLYPVSSKCV
jgi:nicotianamine synthase